MVRRGLFWKFFGASLVLVVLTSLVAGWTASRRLADDVRRDTEDALEKQVTLLHAQLADALPAARDEALQTRVRILGDRTGTRITIVRADGLVLADSSKDPTGMDDHATRPEILASRTREFGHSIRRSDTLGMGMVYVAKRVDGAEGTTAFVRAALPMLQLQSRQRSLYTVVVGAAVFSILIGLVVAFFFARWFAGPLRSMAEAALAIARGDYERRAPTGGADELGELGRAFNRMAARLEQEVGTIRRERRELRAILGGMVEGVIAVDSAERIVLLNDAAGRILEIEPGEAKGQPIWKALRLPKVPDTLADAVSTEAAITTEMDLARDGREQTIRLHASPLAGHDGARRGAVLVLEDVTARRRLDSVRRDFIANASHELKTPVAAIRGLIETIIEDPDMDHLTRRGFLDRVLRQSDRLGGVVEEMLSLSRLESEGLTAEGCPPCDIRAPIREALDDAGPFAVEHGVGLLSTFPEEPVLVCCEAEAVRRVLSNLLDNAIKYSEPESKVHVRAYASNDKIELTVSDRGPGIPLDKQERVFERFYRVDEGRARSVGGSGLGLAIVKHLVQSMGGEVHIESQPGMGSTFRVSWPAA